MARRASFPAGLPWITHRERYGRREMFEKTIEYISELGKRGDLICDDIDAWLEGFRDDQPDGYINLKTGEEGITYRTKRCSYIKEDAKQWLGSPPLSDEQRARLAHAYMLEREYIMHDTLGFLVDFTSLRTGVAEYGRSIIRNYMDQDEYPNFSYFFYHSFTKKAYEIEPGQEHTSELGPTLKVWNYFNNVQTYMVRADLDEIISMSALDIKDTPRMFESGALRLFFDDSYILSRLKPIIDTWGESQPPRSDNGISYLFWTIYLYYLLSHKICVQSKKDNTLPQLPFIYDYRIQKFMYKLIWMAGKRMLMMPNSAQDRIRVLRSKRTRKAGVWQREEEVIKLYNEIDTYERKPYQIARLIHQEMSKTMQAVPTVRTIRDDLKNLGLC